MWYDFKRRRRVKLSRAFQGMKKARQCRRARDGFMLSGLGLSSSLLYSVVPDRLPLGFYIALLRRVSGSSLTHSAGDVLTLICL